MKILALEFSSNERSVAIAEEHNGDCRILASASEQGGRSTRAFALIENALQQAKLEREAIEGIAIGIGPGSYTGIRAAIALAQGWELARNTRAFGISSVQALALQAQSQETRGRLHIVVDAQRNEFYLATFEITDAVCSQINGLRIVPAAKVKHLAVEGEKVVGPDAAAIVGAQVTLPSAEWIARIASGSPAVSAQSIEPIYLRETSFVKAPPPRLIP